MNPYLEQHWRDVHTRLMIYLCDLLQAQLPEGLWASVEEEVTIDDAESASARRFRPDVHVTQAGDAPAGLAATTSGLAVAEPLVLVDPEPPPSGTCRSSRPEVAWLQPSKCLASRTRSLWSDA